MEKTKTLLSVDWDFFFPTPEDDPDAMYDWGHREDMGMFFTHLWPIRASSFISHGQPLPMLSGDEKDFWSRFNIKPGAKLYYAESHTAIWDRHDGVTNVLNYDAHHDSYKPDFENIDCGNWAFHYQVGGALVELVLPKWASHRIEDDKPKLPMDRTVDDGKPVPTPIDEIFVCRSGAWTPTWLDEDFEKFIEKCPVQGKTLIHQLFPRKWNIKDAENYSREIEEQMKQFKEELTK